MYVQLVNMGQTTRRIQQVALNRRLEDDGSVPADAVGWQGFDLAPGEVRFLPMPEFDCALPAWLHVRSRAMRTDSDGRQTEGRADETVIALDNVLPNILPTDWLVAGCVATRSM